MSLFYAFLAIIKRDLLLAVRRRTEIANPLLFFILVITLFPLGIGASSTDLPLRRHRCPAVLGIIRYSA